MDKKCPNMTPVKNIAIYLSMLVLVALFAGLIKYPLVLASIYKKHFPLSIIDAQVCVVIYLIFFYVFQLPAGLLIDLVGITTATTISALIFCIGLVLFSLANHMPLFIIAYLLLSVAASFTYILSITASKELFPSKFFVMLIGFSTLIFAISIALTPIITNLLSHVLTWRMVTLVLLIIVALLMVFYHVFHLRNHQPVESMIEVKNLSTVLHHIKVIMVNKNYWFVSLVFGFFYTHFSVFTKLYGPIYIEQAYSINYMHSIFFNDGALFGYMLGCLTVGFIEEMLSTPWSFLFACVGSVLLYAVIAFLHPLLVTYPAWRYVIYFFLGYFAAYSVLSYRLFHLLSGKTLNATTNAAIFSVVNLFPMLLFFPYIGFLHINFAYGRLFIFATYFIAALFSIKMISRSKIGQKMSR